jgi:hypothetical protein
MLNEYGIVSSSHVINQAEIGIFRLSCETGRSVRRKDIELKTKEREIILYSGTEKNPFVVSVDTCLPSTPL